MKHWHIARTLIAGGEPHSGWLPHGAATPPRSSEYSVRLRIEEADDGVYLLIGTPNGDFDSWHATLPEAKEQARFQYQVDPTEWLPTRGQRGSD